MDKVKEYDVLYAALKAVSSLKEALWAHAWDKRNTTDFREATKLLGESFSMEKSLEEALTKRIPYKMFFDGCSMNLSETEFEAWLAKQDIECAFMGGKAFCFITSGNMLVSSLDY